MPIWPLGHWEDSPPSLRIHCATDLPAVADHEQAEVVALPLSATGEADLARDLIQSAHERLKLGGKLFASTTNRQDTWLGSSRQDLCQLKRRTQESGVLYVATKTEPLKKRKDYSCEFAFRDRGRLIRV